ncbi:MAG: 2-amino-4-hydroxy-6-hydroxymethyldihydropteridine diphosphokinase, partial [Rhizobiaceae bacterium]
MSRPRLSGRSRSVAWLGLGGNLGDPRDAMASALRTIDADAESRVLAVSSIYRTPPWGRTDQ